MFNSKTHVMSRRHNPMTIKHQWNEESQFEKKNYINFLIYDVTFASLKYSSSYLLWIHFIVFFCINLVVFHPPATLSNSIDFDILIICATRKCLNSGLQSLFQSLIDDYLHLLFNTALLESKLPYSISMFPLIIKE